MFEVPVGHGAPLAADAVHCSLPRIAADGGKPLFLAADLRGLPRMKESHYFSGHGFTRIKKHILIDENPCSSVQILGKTPAQDMLSA
jgi:hypothetical protein